MLRYNEKCKKMQQPCKDKCCDWEEIKCPKEPCDIGPWMKEGCCEYKKCETHCYKLKEKKLVKCNPCDPCSPVKCIEIERCFMWKEIDCPKICSCDIYENKYERCVEERCFIWKEIECPKKCGCDHDKHFKGQECCFLVKKIKRAKKCFYDKCGHKHEDCKDEYYYIYEKIGCPKECG